MGLKSFTTDTSDDADTNPGSPGVGTPAMPGFPGLPGGSADDVTDMLINYNEKFKSDGATQFRDQLIEQTLSVLIGKNKPNALLVGPAGVGKTKIAEDIARRIAVGDTLIPAQLADYTVYELPISALVSGTGIVGTLEAKILAVVDFATDPANKAILFIDEIHLLAQRSETYAKIAQILKPALARGDMRVIGATTAQESRDLDNDPAFARRFSRLVVDELTPAQTLDVLFGVRTGLTVHYGHQITVSDEVLEEVVRIADRHSRVEMHRPDNAITLLDRAMAARVLEQRRILDDAQKQTPPNQILIQALQAPVPLTEGRVMDVARQLLTGHASTHQYDTDELRDLLRESVQGQDAVIDRIVDQVSRDELALFPRTTPLAWLFAGASGVGKTQMAKIIAQHVTGQDPIILNMTEYNSAASVARIIGSPAGYVGYDSNAELPFDPLESNPHRLILLDEFEKADVSVQRLFLSALDEGVLKTSRGKRVDFSKAIIVATTNAARAALSGSAVGFGQPTRELSDRSLSNALGQVFDTELLGRFSLVLGFRHISQEIYRDVVAAEYRTQRERIIVDKAHLSAALPIDIPGDELDRLVRETFIDHLGARPAMRAVRVWIEDAIIAARSVTTPAQVAVVSQDSSSDES